jgi:hypothetical protein
LRPATGWRSSCGIVIESLRPLLVIAPVSTAWMPLDSSFPAVSVWTR